MSSPAPVDETLPIPGPVPDSEVLVELQQWEEKIQKTEESIKRLKQEIKQAKETGDEHLLLVAKETLLTSLY